MKYKKIDTLLVIIGTIGVLSGQFLSILLIKQIFAWPILIGLSTKLYDFTEEIERNIVPYDYNKLLSPPKKKDKNV